VVGEDLAERGAGELAVGVAVEVELRGREGGREGEI
jgi:hypothetical protein